MKAKRFFEIIAQGDIFIDLARKYVSFVTFGMMGVMFLVTMNFGLWLNILVGAGIILCVVIAVLIDWFFIFPNKLKKMTKRNPITMEILKTVKEIRDGR